MTCGAVSGVSWEDTRAGWTPETLRKYRSEKWKRAFELREEHKRLEHLANLYRLEIAQAATEALDLSAFIRKRDLFADEFSQGMSDQNSLAASAVTSSR